MVDPGRLRVLLARLAARREQLAAYARLAPEEYLADEQAILVGGAGSLPGGGVIGTSGDANRLVARGMWDLLRSSALATRHELLSWDRNLNHVRLTEPNDTVLDRGKYNKVGRCAVVDEG